RHSTWLAGLADFDDAAAARLLQRRHLTVREACAAVGIDADELDDDLRACADRTLREIADGADDSCTSRLARLHAALRRPDVTPRIARTRETQRQLVRDYV